MHLSYLEVSCVRNLQPLRLHPHPRFNFIVGPNGSGKTSLLESIQLLSTGRSFRTTAIQKVIDHAAQELVVFGEVASVHESSTKLGIRKHRNGETLVRINGERHDRISDLAAILPVIALDASAFDLLDGGPSERRQILDWGVFHVEPDFHGIWRQYQTALKQKSALLRQGLNTVERRNQLVHWNHQVAVWGEQLHAARLRYMHLIQEALARVISRYTGKIEAQLSYRPGWNAQQHSGLENCLHSHLEQEIERQSCLFGPHRADLDILWSNRLARDVCSRGQKKLIVYAVRLAQVMVLIQHRHLTPILLLDDIPAELDPINLTNIARFLNDYPCQSFITSIDEQDLRAGFLGEQDRQYRMFHVEHGQFTPSSA